MSNDSKNPDFYPIENVVEEVYVNNTEPTYNNSISKPDEDFIWKDGIKYICIPESRFNLMQELVTKMAEYMAINSKVSGTGSCTYGVAVDMCIDNSLNFDGWRTKQIQYRHAFTSLTGIDLDMKIEEEKEE